MLSCDFLGLTNLLFNDDNTAFEPCAHTRSHLPLHSVCSTLALSFVFAPTQSLQKHYSLCARLVAGDLVWAPSETHFQMVQKVYWRVITTMGEQKKDRAELWCSRNKGLCLSIGISRILGIELNLQTPALGKIGDFHWLISQSLM
jgi:hypothetical protein